MDDVPAIPTQLLAAVLASVLAAADANSETADSIDAALPWDVSAIGAKGYGAFAKVDLVKGQLLISERPLCVWPQGLSPAQAKELFDQLSVSQKAQYQELCLAESGGVTDEILSRRAANGFAIRLPQGDNEGTGETLSFIFPQIARMNHSCSPNVAQAMNFTTLRMELYVIVPSITAGTELTIEYTPLVTLNRADRLKALAGSFGFTKCYCTPCMLPEEEGIKSDARRQEIGQLSESLGSTRAEMRASLERIEVLLAEEGYLGLPEFEDPNMSNGYARFAMMKAQGA